MDFIRRFFGLSNARQFDETLPKYSDTNAETRGFQVFTDPLQMHQYFEHQMNEMLKTFGFHGFDDGFFSEFYNVPALESEMKLNDNENHCGTLREQFLKSGYEKPSQKHVEKMDKDIDEKINLADLDSIFGKKNYDSPYKRNMPENFFFGQSQSVKTIMKPDGSVETHRTIRDNEGNEETTVCHKIGTKEYCIIKKKDKYGKEEVIENFINMDENEIK